MIRRFGLFALVLALGLGAGLRDRLDALIDATQLPPVLAETSVEMRDRHGTLLRAFPVEGGRIRLAVDHAQVDADFLAMLIAYEDKRFYQHAGIDPAAMLRALWQSAWSGRVVSGGSTLTMQVARLIENSGTGRWAGKLRQMRVALALERRLGKDEILTLYLTHAPYGGAVEGLRAATWAWFGKEPTRLTPAEAALMVALPQAPESRRPDRHPTPARQARNRVLQRTGAAHEMRRSDVPARLRPFPRLAPHLTDALRIENPLALRHDLTLDAQTQGRIAALARRGVAGRAAQVSMAIVVADHTTGAVLASVGSPDYDGARQGFVDMTRALRSPGSTLKPFVYGMAFDQGLVHPDTLISDAPVTFGRYAPRNFDGRFRGDIPVREALQLSLNIPPVLLTHELGPARLMAGLRRGGARPVLRGKAGLAVVLGGVGLTLNDLVQLYGGLAQEGRAPVLHWTLNAPPTRLAAMMSRSAAWQVGHILAGLAPPHGQVARTGQIAYKTGTSYGHRDAWAIGFDGQHVIGVWLGRPDGTPVPGAFGGDSAAPALFEAFSLIKPVLTPFAPPPPETLFSGGVPLPLPLQRFRPRDTVFAGPTNRPIVTFPPEGAVLDHATEGVPLKLRQGVLPLTVMVNGAPVLTGLRRRNVVLPALGAGFSQITVVDARGQSAAVGIRVMR